MEDRAGQQFGNYRLLRLLGSGSFAEVYLGKHRYLETQAAVKVLRTTLAAQEIEPFRLEARTIAHLIHPHIVRVLEFGVEQTTPFLVMDYAPHGSLRKLHPKGMPLPLALVVAYVQQIASALHYAHARNLIHCDLKPENLLLSENDDVLLSDFGIASVAHSTTSMRTQAYAGTPVYSAPEQIRGKPRAASDQYAMGILVYEWLTGRPPFLGDITQVLYQHLEAAPPPLREKLPTLSHEVVQVVLRALEKDPAQRFPDVLAFARALQETSRAAASEWDSTLANTQAPPAPMPVQAVRSAHQESIPAQIDAEVASPEPAKPLASVLPAESIPSHAPALSPTPPVAPAGQAQLAAMTEPPVRPAIRLNLALVGFTALALSLVGLGIMDAQLLPSAWISIVLLGALGGLIQLVTGVQSLRGRDTFAGTALCSSGAFWLALALIAVPASGIILDPGGLAYFFLAWTILTGVLLLASLKGGKILVAFFALLFLSLLALTLGQFAGSNLWVSVSGWLSIATFVTGVPLLWSLATHPQQAMIPVSLTVQPLPPGLGAFAAPLFFFSVLNARLAPASGVSILAGLALFSGGLIGFIAGVLTWRGGKTTVGALFCTYGIFWAVLGLFLLPAFHLLTSLTTLIIGLFFLAWAIVTCALLIASRKSGRFYPILALAALLTFLAFAIGGFTSGSILFYTGGWLGMVASAIAWYGMLALLLRETKGPFRLPIGVQE